MKKIWLLIKTTVSGWNDDYAQSMGAALAFYTLFSITPVLLIVLSILGLVFGADAAQGQIVGQLKSLLGEQGALAVQTLLENVNKPEEGLIASLIGVVLLLVGATTVFAELQSALDRIWRAPDRVKVTGIIALLNERLL